MKSYKSILLLFIIIFTNCKPIMYKKSVVREQDIVNMEYETFDMDYFEKKKNYFNEIYEEYIKDDGTKVEIWGNLGGSFLTFEYPPTPYFYKVYKTYYGNGELHDKGILLPSACRIGKWMECDEKGVCEIIDYDEGMGKFDYSHVLKFLDKKGCINLKTGDGKENFVMGYSYEQKSWTVEATADSVYWTRYILDGNSGKILKEELLPVKH